MYRKALPQISSDSLFLTDGGLETFLIYKKGLDLQQFAAFPALKDEEGKKFIKEYYTNYYQVRFMCWLANAKDASIYLINKVKNLFLFFIRTDLHIYL